MGAIITATQHTMYKSKRKIIMEVAGGHGVIVKGVGDNAIQGVVDIMAGPRVTAGHREAARETGSHEFGGNEEEE